MRTYTALAAALIVAASLLPMTGSAEGERTALLRVMVTDAANQAVPGARVTIYTVDGNPGVTVTADKQGVAIFDRLSAGLTQVVAASDTHAFYAEATRLALGQNDYRVTLQPQGTDAVTSDTSLESSYYVVVRASDAPAVQ